MTDIHIDHLFAVVGVSGLFVFQGPGRIFCLAAPIIIVEAHDVRTGMTVVKRQSVCMHCHNHSQYCWEPEYHHYTMVRVRAGRTKRITTQTVAEPNLSQK